MFEKLRKALDYNSTTGVFRWKINRANKKIGERAGNFNVATGYRTVMVSYKAYYEHRLAWAFVHGKFPRRGMTIDHINGRREDNRIKNLRVVPMADNGRNRTRLNKNNTSGVNGVSYNHDRGLWEARVMVNRKTKILGRYTTLQRAKAIREKFNAAEICSSGSAFFC